jgi:hypothetical protein
MIMMMEYKYAMNKIVLKVQVHLSRAFDLSVAQHYFILMAITLSY